jgi:hypothetical protein
VGIDRVKDTSFLEEGERRKLAAVADHVSYLAGARASARSTEQVPSHFSLDRRSERPRP